MTTPAWKGWAFSGTIVHGDGRGATHTVATANLPDQAAAPKGVFVVRVSVNGRTHIGLMHHGLRPTFNASLSLEVHILDFNQDIYGQELSGEIVAYIRDVRAFENADALRAQIAQDELFARKWMLRDTIRTHWKNTTQEEKDTWAHLGADALKNWSTFQNAQNIYAFWPLPDEIPYVPLLVKQFPEKHWHFPITDGAGKMQFYTLPAGTSTPPKTPQSTHISPSPQPNDLILVPALACGEDGTRLGRGGGYYDRWLAQYPDTPTVSLQPHWAVFSSVPTAPHDQTLGRVMSLG